MVLPSFQRDTTFWWLPFFSSNGTLIRVKPIKKRVKVKIAGLPPHPQPSSPSPSTPWIISPHPLNIYPLRLIAYSWPVDPMSENKIFSSFFFFWKNMSSLSKKDNSIFIFSLKLIIGVGDYLPNTTHLQLQTFSFRKNRRQPEQNPVSPKSLNIRITFISKPCFHIWSYFP